MTDIVSPPDPSDTAARIAWARRVCHSRRRYARLVSGKAIVKMAETILVDAGLPVPVGRAPARRRVDGRAGDDGGFDRPRGDDRVGSAWVVGGGDGGGGCD